MKMNQIASSAVSTGCIRNTVNNCKYLYDWWYICCNGDCKAHVADACPYDTDAKKNCKYYKEEKHDKPRKAPSDDG